MDTAGSDPEPRRAHPSRFAYPVFLDLHGVLVVVVGGGRIGARKAAGLAAAGAHVRLVATVVSEHVDPADTSEIRRHPFSADDLDDARLVITATGDPATDARIAATARQRGIWVNAADQPADCDFILPAVHRAGRVTAALSTDGSSPALAASLRDRIGSLLTAEVADLAAALERERRAIRASGGSTEDVDWARRIESVLDGLTGTPVEVVPSRRAASDPAVVAHRPLP